MSFVNGYHYCISFILNIFHLIAFCYFVINDPTWYKTSCKVCTIIFNKSWIKEIVVYCQLCKNDLSHCKHRCVLDIDGSENYSEDVFQTHCTDNDVLILSILYCEHQCILAQYITTTMGTKPLENKNEYIKSSKG